MREPVRDKGRLEHMLLAISNVEEFTKDVTLEEFVKSKVLFYAVVKNIEIVGEATYMLTKEFKESQKSVPWQVIEKMRHVLVHGYYTISPEKVWDTVQEDIPVLKKQLLSILENLYTVFILVKEYNSLSLLNTLRGSFVFMRRAPNN